MDTEPPTKQGVLGWLRLNLSITLALCGLLSGSIGALVTGTLRVAAADYQITDLARTTDDQQKQITQFHMNMVDVDRRLNDAASRVNELRRTRDGEVAALSQRVAVLEAQIRFLADRTTAPPIGTHK